MIGFSILSILFDNVIATKLVNKIFHSVIIREDKGQPKPGAPVNGRFVYVGVDDTKGFTCYCRAIGPIESVSEEKLASCGGTRLVRTQTLHRIVFFNNNEQRSFDGISSKLLTAVMNSGNHIKFVRMLTDAKAILGGEAPNGSFKFTDSTYYTAIEFYVFLNITTDSCGGEIGCENVANPYCK